MEGAPRNRRARSETEAWRLKARGWKRYASSLDKEMDFGSLYSRGQRLPLFPETYPMLRQAPRRGVSSEVQGGEIILCD
jgi:hypothetical protein